MRIFLALAALTPAVIIGVWFVRMLLRNAREAYRPDYYHISKMEHELGLATRERPCSFVACSTCIQWAQMTGAWGPEGYEEHKFRIERGRNYVTNYRPTRMRRSRF